ncbi:MAG: sensor histidine kinase [Stackebrandtia sp.]
MAKGEASQRRTSSVRLRFMLSIAAAVAGVLVLGTIQTGTALLSNEDANRAEALSHLAGVTARILTAAQAEVAETTSSHESDGGLYEHSYAEAVGITDDTVEEFQGAAETARESVPNLEAVLVTAESALAQLESTRGQLAEFAQDDGVALDDPAVVSGFDMYNSIGYRVLDVGDELHRYIADGDLAAQARAVAALAGVKQVAGDQRLLVRNALSMAEASGGDKDVPPETLTDLAKLRGMEQQRSREFYRAASPSAKGLYAKDASGPSIDRSDQIINDLLGQRPMEFSSQEWDAAQSEKINKLHQIESTITQDLSSDAKALSSDSRQTAVITVTAVLLVVVLSFGTAMFLAIRISKRLRSLRHDALTAAGDTLPMAVAEMTEARSEKQVTDITASAEDKARTERPGPADEIGAVSQAFTVVHCQALRLAADQAMLRLDVAAMMIALARRGQSLVQRQLHMLDEFTAVERDPDSVSRLRALNHLASRMRRNEENLLLLAGGDPGRRHNSATPVARAVAEAAAEIEDSERVVVEDSAEAPIVANAVGDVVHLLAELLENAALFSPPHTKVRVATRRTVHEVVVSVADEGIGLPPEQVAEINARLSEPSGLTSSLAGTMGLLVVARLAARHGIEVQLHSTAGKGTLAVARLPELLIAKDSRVDPRLRPGGGPRPDRFDMYGQPMPSAGPLALAAEPAALPMTGTGERPSSHSYGAIVPRSRTPAAGAEPDRGRPMPQTRPQGRGQTDWFMPSTGSGDSPSQPPGSLSWRAGAGDVAYDKTRKMIAQTHRDMYSTPPDADDASLPRRRPGERLLPGGVEDAPGASRPGVDGIDPDEIRSRLSGFAGGIAAASESPTGDPQPPESR